MVDTAADSLRMRKVRALAEIKTLEEANAGAGSNLPLEKAKRLAALKTEYPGRVRWMSRHFEEGRVLVVARIGQAKAGYSVRLMDPRRPAEADTCYLSRSLAVDVADMLVRARYTSHVCTASCAGWTVGVYVRRSPRRW
jgi:hypothetical protein